MNKPLLRMRTSNFDNLYLKIDQKVVRLWPDWLLWPCNYYTSIQLLSIWSRFHMHSCMQKWNPVKKFPVIWYYKGGRN